MDRIVHMQGVFPRGLTIWTHMAWRLVSRWYHAAVDRSGGAAVKPTIPPRMYEPAVDSEWRLITATHNLLKLHRHSLRVATA